MKAFSELTAEERMEFMRQRDPRRDLPIFTKEQQHMATEIQKCNPRNDHDFNSVDVTPEQPFLSALATEAAVQAAKKRKPIEKVIKLYCRKCGEIRSL